MLSHSLTPAECSTIQIHSDALSMQIASDSTGLELSPTTLPSTSDASHKSSLSPLLRTEWL